MSLRCEHVRLVMQTGGKSVECLDCHARFASVADLPPLPTGRASITDKGRAALRGDS